MEKLSMHTLSAADRNYSLLKGLFPNAITETIDEAGNIVRAIDADVLSQEINKRVVAGSEERYQFTWPDKKKSILLANTPIAKTLRPSPEESVDFDTTENLYIEGDNLEVLKLLQETYLGKVKMIYIDPPYNTGNDFVYEDDFAQNADEYLANSGQFDVEGNRLVQNTESNGRFHTDWLNMMYPRLKIAKDLLNEEGVIFISIDDNEQGNLKKICDEIFGGDNFITSLIWAAGRKNDSKYISVSHEYILCYVKSLATLTERKIIWREKKQGLEDIYLAYARFKNEFKNDTDSIANALKKWYKDLPDNHAAKNHSHYCCADEKGIYFASDISWPGGGGPKYEVLHPLTKKPVRIPNRGWVFPTQARMQEMINAGLIHFGADENSVPCKKTYLTEGEYSSPYSVFYKDGRASTKRLRTLMGAMVFQNPKDEEIIKSLIAFTSTGDDGIVLDFFSGSSTTAHAVMKLNSEDQGKRKFIMVQIPEETEGKSEAYKAGFKNICEIGKERIRRAGAEIKNESGLTALNLDTGFRVLKVDSTNMKSVYYNPDEYTPTLFDNLADNIKEDRTSLDLLFQVMLEMDVLLSSKITEIEICGKKVYSVMDDYMIACFDKGITSEVVEAIAKKEPYYAVFRDSCMADDSTMTSFEQIFETYSKDTIRKVL